MGSVEKIPNVKVKKFMEEAKVLAAKHGIVFNDKMARGDRYNIVKLAHGKDDFDTAVIGSRGSSTKEIFFGSLSNYVIHTSKIPVVIVK